MERRAIEEAYRFCPSCGVSARQLGSVPFRCEACNFANFFGPVAAVGGLIINALGELLFVRRAREPGKGKWGLPGGFVDRDETVEQALIREIVEETGLCVSQTRYLTTYPNQYNYRGLVAPVIDLFYVCRVKDEGKIQIAEDELEHYQWSTPTPELLQDMAFESNRLAVEFWVAQERSI